MVSAIIFDEEMLQETPQACVTDLIPPVGGEINLLLNNLDGSVQASWDLATDVTNPIYYELYCQKSSAAGLFSSEPVAISKSLTEAIYRDSNKEALVEGFTYYCGVRARDGQGNINSNTEVLSIVAQGIDYANLLIQIKSISSSDCMLVGEVTPVGMVGEVEAISLTGTVESENLKC